MVEVINNPGPANNNEGSSAGWMVAIIILIIVAGGLAWFLWRGAGAAPAAAPEGGTNIQVEVPTPQVPGPEGGGGASGGAQ